MTTRYVVRDIATKGRDFLMWGDDDPDAAHTTLNQALRDGLEVELVIIPPEYMTDET